MLSCTVVMVSLLRLLVRLFASTGVVLHSCFELKIEKKKEEISDNELSEREVGVEEKQR